MIIPGANKKMKKLLGIVAILNLGCIWAVQAQLPAFPGAEGAGSLTSGGRGSSSAPTTVYEVTSLSDAAGASTTAGTLRYALTQTATSRTIVFRVSGTIHLTSALKIAKANTTIAGQTAPDGGICLADYPVSINANNVIVRYMHFRMGDKNELKTSPASCGVPVTPFSASCMPLNGSGGDDAFDGVGYKNIIVDHCTMSWSNDEACTFYSGDSVTLQWNLISEPLNYSYHFETGDVDFEHHGYGGIWGGKHASFHHNLIAHCNGRAPRFDGIRNIASETADFRNNVIYNWGDYNVNGGEGGNYNLVNNYYKYGPSTKASGTSGISSVKYMVANPYKQASPAIGFGHYYIDGNYVDGSATITASNWKGVAFSGGSFADSVTSKATTPFGFMPVTTYSAEDAYDTVLKYVGAMCPSRDTLDDRIIDDVKNRTGKLIDVQGGYAHATAYAQTTGAWPALATGTAPLDSDHDGMTDDWENANGLNPNNAGDRNGVALNNYTNLENYLNGIICNAPLLNVVGYMNGSKEDVIIYPNPAKDFINIKYAVGNANATATLYSITGVKVETMELDRNGNEVTMNIRPLAKGVYFIRFQSEMINKTVKFIKE